MAIRNRPPSSRVTEWLGGKSGSRVLGLIVLPVLLIAALLLPPIALLERVMDAGMTRVAAEGATLVDPDGTEVTFQTVQSSFKAQVSSVSRVAFLEGSAGKELLTAAKSIPPHLVPKSPFYQLKTKGTAEAQTNLLLPIPNDSEPYDTLDVYTWDEATQSWQWLPHNLLFEDDMIESQVNFVPNSAMVMQTNPMPAIISADLAQAGQLPAEGQGALAQIHPTGLYLADGGTLEGSIDASFDQLSGGLEVIPVVRNYEGQTVRSDLLANMLIDPDQQAAHIDALVNLAVGNVYAGIDLDYLGLQPDLRAEFNQFVKGLADALHEQNKTLSVRVERPVQVAEDRWETGAYDWRTLGLLADVIKLPAPIDPRAYVDGGQLEALLKFATGQANRYNVSLVLNGQSVEEAGAYLLPKNYADALQPLMGRIQADPAVVEPGQPLNLALVSTRANSGLVYDPNIGAYVYRYQDDQGGARTVWLENAASLSHKLEQIKRFGIFGFVLENLPANAQDPDLWGLMRDYQQGQARPIDSNFTVEWTVRGSDGQLVSQVRPLGDAGVSITAPSAPGAVEIRAAVVDRGQVLAENSLQDVAVATYTPVATPTPVATATPTPSPTPDFAELSTKSGSVNVRSGPGTDYPKVGQIAAGQSYRIVGKSEDGQWFQVTYDDKNLGWVSGELVAVNGSVEAVAMVKVEPPPTAAPRPTSSAPAAAPVTGPRVAPPASAGSFGYGIQIPNYNVAGFSGQIAAAGFNWVKIQVPWKDIEGNQGAIDWGGLEGMVNEATGAGLKFMASVPKAPAWARGGGADLSVEGPPADPGTYASFVGQLAGRFCGRISAIEVWNEQNLHYEWGNQPLDPAAYVRLLAAAYRSIKAACPGTVVVSGALTPTGAPAPWAMDDFTYLELMYQAGLKNVSDAIGAHPSGYNVSPDVGGGAAACDFIRSQGASFVGPCNSPHHSWSFRATMEGYHNIMCKYGDCGKRIWPTEFGWAAGWMGKPGYEYANDNTQEEEAAWTVRAYQMMKAWGFVGTAFLWNLGFTDADGGQWNIAGRPAYAALAGMGK